MLRILLVEDNEMNGDMLARRLTRQGWEVALAKTGRDAVRMAAEGAPDLILLDMSLPEIDGWTAARMLRENPRTKDIGIIALTAHAMPGDRERALNAGCDAFETKPIDFAGLRAQIGNLAARGAQQCR